MKSEKTDDVLEVIRANVLSKLDIKISKDDPIFSLVLANQAVLDRLADPLVLAVKQIPGEMGLGIEKIAAAVENAERTVEKLVEEGKTALADARANEAKKLLKFVRESLEFNKGVSHTKFSIIVGICLFFALSMTAIGGISYFAVKEASKDSEFWYKKWAAQDKKIQTLPPAIKKLFQP
ncbi:hypothetical protein C5U62_31390 [Pseudomonas protegens]|uniref:Uncharacterized protein n=1 Tax=Pseudomonas protegens TaxID=380021 RepID=A0A2T6GBE8_9PSED|nr:hypothetical protein [Pseudomonas protegens]PUA41475.1 hypothetical protein C5U62_31390 [Pseudomonas protegens]